MTHTRIKNYWIQPYAIHSALAIVYSTINVCARNIENNGSSPFLLTFLESYDPNWYAKIEKNKINPIVSWSYANSFLVETVPEGTTITINLNYGPQKYLVIGLSISALTFLIFISIMLKELHARLKVRMTAHRLRNR